jgi:hypothetical protein
VLRRVREGNGGRKENRQVEKEWGREDMTGRRE